ncbi:MAG: hypothetical protein IPK26_11785 [Planctomycetes bacterium]|nr:hypothetical protein [Planctomycetota bacterium]
MKFPPRCAQRRARCGAFLVPILCLPAAAQSQSTQSLEKGEGSAVVLPAAARGGDATARRPPLAATIANAEGSAALELRDGELRANGDRYKAVFGAAHVDFIPALGRRAPHNQPLHLELAQIGRGQDHAPVPAPERRHDALRVEYVRRECVERYDVTPQGLEQSFVFTSLPAGSGDLHVRVRFGTELQPIQDHLGWRFELPGVGGLRLGGVTGIDAGGKRATGSVEVRGDIVDLSLPASFVDGASLPLVLDPLIGSVFNAFTSDLDDGDPDVAYDVTNDVYLVVFERTFSATDIDIHGQRVSGAGTLVGGRVFIENGLTNEFDGAVANVNLRDHFVVAYYRAGDIMARSVNAATGAVTAEIAVASGTDTQTQCDIGGEATTSDDDALCVWWNSTASAIEAAQITVAADGTLSWWDPTTIYASTTLPGRYPRISKGGGDTGNHAIAFEKVYSATDVDPYVTLVNRELTILDDARAMDSGVNYARLPDVDGDGRHWVVAWELEESAFPGMQDILCRSLTWNPAATTGNQGALGSSITTITADANDDEYAASVTWVGGSTLVGWTDNDGTAYNAYFRSIDPFTCLACESTGQYWLAGGFAWDYFLKGCSQASGGGDEDEALLVIETNDNGGTGTSSIQAQRWQSVDGTLAELASACGLDAGDIYLTCARSGNAGFSARLASDLASTTAALIVSRDYLGMPCGSCRLIPDPYSGFVFLTTTGSNGQAALDAALPASAAIVGLSFYAQWLVAEPVSPGCYLFGSDLTRALRMTIQ